MGRVKDIVPRPTCSSMTPSAVISARLPYLLMIGRSYTAPSVKLAPIQRSVVGRAFG
jgi:hypothetical protein